MRKTQCSLLFVLIVFVVVTNLTGAFALFTDYQSAHLQAESGVSLIISKNDGIVSATQEGYILEQGGIGRYKAGGIATLAAKTDKGYRFDGWYEDDILLSTDSSMSFTVDSSASIEARASLIDYHLSFILDGGNFLGSVPSTYTVVTDDLTLPIPVKEGCIFAGWYETETFAGEAVQSISKGNMGDRIYYAKWIETTEEKTYALILDNPNDAENSSPMIFAKAAANISAGDTFNSKRYGTLKVKSVYEDFEEDDADDESGALNEKAGHVPWADHKLNVTSVYVEDEIQPVSTAFWFYEFWYCSDIDLSNLNAERLKNTTCMFYDAGSECSDFVIDGLERWDVSGVKKMESMFEKAGYYASSLSISSIDDWNVENVENMSRMFRDTGYRAKNWHIGDLSGWKTQSLQYMDYMFYSAGRTAETFDLGNLGGWQVGQVGSMQRLFYNAGYAAKNYNIGALDKWDVSKVENMEGMFYASGYASTTWSIGDLSNWEVGQVTDMSSMFGRTGRETKSWDIGNLNNWDVSNVEKMQYMFDGAGYNSTSFLLRGLEQWNTAKVTNMSYMFYNAGYRASWNLNCSGWNVSNVKTHTNFNRSTAVKVIEPAWN